MLNTKNTTVIDASPIYRQDFTSARRPRDYYFDYSIRAYDNYYNWYSATAGNGTYEKNENEVVSGNICPTGWYLPYGGYKANEKGGNTSGGFYYLTQSMNNGNSADTANNWRTFPNNIVYSGYISDSQIWIRGREGDYWSTANSLYNTDIIAGNNQYDRFPRYNNDNTTAPVANMTEYNNDVNVYSFGNYYTWSAAIANTDDYPSKYEHSNVATSICPAGWHLPYGGNGTSDTNIGNTSGGFYYLGDKIGGNSEEDENSSKAWRAFPNNIIYSGGYYKSDARYKTIGSSYWANSAYGSGGSNRMDAFRLDVSTVVYVTGNMEKYHGSSVRCVMQAQ